MGLIAELLLESLQKRLKSNSLLFWYDTNKYFKNWIQKCEFDNLHLIQFKDSWFRVKYELENSLNSAICPKIIVYLPLNRHEYLNINPIAECEKIAEIFEETFENIVRRGFEQKYTHEEVTSLLGDPNNTFETLDGLSGFNAPQIPPNLIIHFPNQTHTEIVSELLTSCDISILEKKIDLVDLQKFFKDFYGFEIKETSSLSLLINQIAPFFLFFDLYNDLASKDSYDVIEHHINYSYDLRPDQKANCIRFLKYWRSIIPENYRKRAQSFEKIANINIWRIPVDLLVDSETFRQFDFILLKELSKIENYSPNELNSIAISRKSLFWSKNDDIIKAYWTVAEICYNLMNLVEEYTQELSISDLSFERIIKRYTQDWYKSDTLYRKLESELHYFYDDLPFEELIDRTRRIYFNFIENLNSHFSKYIHSYVSTILTKQSDFFPKYVKDHYKNQKTCVMFVDALRFEMGKGLIESLDVDKKSIYPVLAFLPTITKIGMNAILPDAKNKMNVIKNQKKLVIRIDEKTMVNSTSRIGWIKDAIDTNIKDITLDAVLTKKGKLKKQFINTQLLIVRSQEIDLLGEQDILSRIRRELNSIIVDLKKSIEILGRMGFQRFFIISDHGFCFGRTLTDDYKLDPPTGKVLELHRRVWIGQESNVTDNMIKIKGDDLGYMGGIDLVFPASLGGFKKAGGNSTYLHGGTSIQEIIVPIIDVELQIKSKDIGKDKISIKVIGIDETSKKITNKVFRVELIFQRISQDLGGFFGDKKRKVICQVKLDKEIDGSNIHPPLSADKGFNSETKEVELDEKEKNSVVFILPDVLKVGTLKIQITDPLTNTILNESVAIKYEFLF